ncbi:MAG: hypothetical protein JNL01_07950 [Bdellovibrionales bacterium]|nr:hypothetical protein [Bdellovibrionales bacterium]
MIAKSTATALRLGNSPIHWDWTRLNAGGVLLESEIKELEKEFALSWEKLRSRFLSGEVGFYHAPTEPELNQAKESIQLANELLEKHHFTDALFLGIGGSSLGPIALLSALREKAHDQVRIHYLENPDPIEWKMTLKRLNPESTLVVPVTKSGSTFETIAQFLLALDWLGKDRWKSNVVCLTDPEKGDLLQFAKKNDLRCLKIHPSLGGRFSIFSPVGLFPAALCGLNVEAFLKGASDVRDFNEKVSLDRNPFFQIGSELIRQFEERPIHICMPYSTPLRAMGSWFVQLWGESLGKDEKGFTPLSALGATDQHSILQLMRDGPDDKITWFLKVDQVSDPVTIPEALPGGAGATPSSFTQLQGHSLHRLLNVEADAIAQVLTKRERPHLIVTLDQLDEAAMGSLCFSWALLTAVTGTLWGVDPFDQPGVEEGKIYIRESLARLRNESRSR